MLLLCVNAYSSLKRVCDASHVQVLARSQVTKPVTGLAEPN
jgi:hypothetical protein